MPMNVPAGIVIVAVACILPRCADAQESAPPVIRQIAPDQFQPTLRGDYGAAAAPVVATPPTREHPFGSCERGSRNWLICLRATADVSNLMVDEAENRVIASLLQRPNLTPSLQRVLAKALTDAEVAWVALRDQECNQLALLEAGAGVQLYEAQLKCRLSHNAERIDQLSSRYAIGASQQPAAPRAP